MSTPQDGAQLWLELAPHKDTAPKRLLIFLHGAGSSPEAIAPLAIAWQTKFPSAVALVLQGLNASRTGHGLDWFDGRGPSREQHQRAQAAAQTITQRIAAAQARTGLGPESTAVIGFSQGATLALEIARQPQVTADIIVAHAGRLLAPLPPGTDISPSIHLLHGELDSVVLAQHSMRAFRALRDAGATVSLDILADGIHSVGQDMVNVGTARVLQTLFAGRKRIELDQYDSTLTVSTDSSSPQIATNTDLH